MERLEAAIGYRFTDKALLRRAMTHSSHSNETGEKNHHLLCNERLEFLGDSVLSIAVSRYLYATYPQEGEGVLTNMRKDVVCAEALARYARQIGIGPCLLLGKGEAQTGGCDKENILADAFEALLAAFYLDDVTVLHGGARQRAAADARLAVAHGELVVGREQEGRVIVARAVVRDVLHVRFLVRAEQHAHGVGQALAARGHAVGPELHRMERDHNRPLVVAHAPAHQVALMLSGAEDDGEQFQLLAGKVGTETEDIA
jgi:hypothetical protein